MRIAAFLVGLTLFQVPIQHFGTIVTVVADLAPDDAWSITIGALQGDVGGIPAWVAAAFCMVVGGLLMAYGLRQARGPAGRSHTRRSASERPKRAGDGRYQADPDFTSRLRGVRAYRTGTIEPKIQT